VGGNEKMEGGGGGRLEGAGWEGGREKGRCGDEGERDVRERGDGRGCGKGEGGGREE